jgi:hypothetical protein
MSSTLEDKPDTTNRRTEADSDDLHVDLDDSSLHGDEEAEAAEIAAMKARGEFGQLLQVLQS